MSTAPARIPNATQPQSVLDSSSFEAAAAAAAAAAGLTPLDTVEVAEGACVSVVVCTMVEVCVSPRVIVTCAAGGAVVGWGADVVGRVEVVAAGSVGVALDSLVAGCVLVLIVRVGVERVTLAPLPTADAPPPPQPAIATAASTPNIAATA